MKRPAKPLKSAQTVDATPLRPLEPANSPKKSSVPPLSSPPPKPRVSFRRLGVRTFRFAALTATLGAFAVGSGEIAKAAAQTSPLVFLVAALDGSLPSTNGLTRGFVGVSLVGASIFSSGVLFASLLTRRFYCRFICPLGTAVDAAAVVRRRLFPRRFRFLRNGFVVRAPRFALFFGSLTLGSLALSLLFGVSFGVGTALELDPTALLSRWTLDFPAFGVLGGVFLTAFVAAPLFWRFHICPCGALQDVCFFGTRAVFRRLQPASPRKVDAVSPIEPSRRRFLRTLAAVGLAAATLGAVRCWSARVFAATPFRPPGALPENAFLSRCSRCGRCVAACPSRLLRFDALPSTDKTDNVGKNGATVSDEPPAKTAATVKTSPLYRPAPELVFDDGAFCEKDCVACGTACPTGAISPLTLDVKKRYKITTVEFKIEHCLIYYQQECAICRRECPFDAIDLVWNEEEYASLPVVAVQKCVGCGRCVAFCPGEPIFAEFADEKTDDAPRPKALVLRPARSANETPNRRDS